LVVAIEVPLQGRCGTGVTLTVTLSGTPRRPPWSPNACNGYGEAIIAPGAKDVKQKMPVSGNLGGDAAYGAG